MELEKREQYLYIQSSENSFIEFNENFQGKLDIISENHIILDLSQLKSLKKEDFLLFLDLAKLKQRNGTSFVIISKMANADDYPEFFNVVPTFKEAEDILEMEAIERELGF